MNQPLPGPAWLIIAGGLALAAFAIVASAECLRLRKPGFACLSAALFGTGAVIVLTRQPSIVYITYAAASVLIGSCMALRTNRRVLAALGSGSVLTMLTTAAMTVLLTPVA